MTAIVWPLSVTGLIPDSADQILAVPSAPADNITIPDGKYLHLYTELQCPFRSKNTSPGTDEYYLTMNE